MGWYDMGCILLYRDQWACVTKIDANVDVRVKMFSEEMLTMHFSIKPSFLLFTVVVILQSGLSS